MEYAASPPHHDFSKGKLGMQSVLDFSSARSEAVQESIKNAITMTMTIRLTDRRLEPPANMYAYSFRRPYAVFLKSVFLNQCSARRKRRREEDAHLAQKKFFRWNGQPLHRERLQIPSYRKLRVPECPMHHYN